MAECLAGDVAGPDTVTGKAERREPVFVTAIDCSPALGTVLVCTFESVTVAVDVSPSASSIV